MTLFLFIIATAAAAFFCYKYYTREDWSRITKAEQKYIMQYPTAQREDYARYVEEHKDVHPIQRFSDWKKNQRSEFITFSVAGINYRTGIKRLVGDIDVTLKDDPENPYDADAIKINETTSGKHIGYIHADETSEVRAIVDLPHRCRCHIEECQDYYNKKFFYGEIRIKNPY